MADPKEARRIETGAVVIGAGPGGYVCAIRLAQLGVQTVIIEKGTVGGVCLNVGCIPSKALITASKLVTQIRDAEAMGIHVDGVRVDLARMVAWKESIVGKLTGGVAGLLKGNGVKHLAGAAKFVAPHALEVTDAQGQVTTVAFEAAVIATGSTPMEIPGFEPDGVNVVTSTEALAFTALPKRMVVIGGGYIGMEMGGAYQRLGTQVTVVEYASQLLPGFEKDLVRPVQRRFGKKGYGGEVLTGTKAVSWSRPAPNEPIQVTVENVKTGIQSVVETDVILLTVGRVPRAQGLGLKALGLRPDAQGFIAVDGAQRTGVDHIYAIGDVAGQPMLAHKASKEGEVAAEVIAGHNAAYDVKSVPAVVFTDPEIATVGLSVKQANDAGYVTKTGKFAFAANGRALSMNEAEGFVRVVMDADTEVLLGMEAVGPEVSNLIAEAALAIEMGALVSDIGLTVHAHPTLPEAVMEAANAALGQAIHALNR